jgi:hypothetical protein
MIYIDNHPISYLVYRISMERCCGITFVLNVHAMNLNDANICAVFCECLVSTGHGCGRHETTGASELLCSNRLISEVTVTCNCTNH